LRIHRDFHGDGQFIRERGYRRVCHAFDEISAKDSNEWSLEWPGKFELALSIRFSHPKHAFFACVREFVFDTHSIDEAGYFWGKSLIACVSCDAT
jgi:hypothetical protein